MDSSYPQQSADFYEALGRALARWQAVEVQLPLLYSLIIGAKKPQAVWASFRTILSLGTRLQVIEAAAESALTSPALEVTQRVCAKLRTASANRNRLAHYMYNAVVDETGRVDIFLANTKRNPAVSDSSAVRIDDIQAWQEEWNALLLEVTDAVVLTSQCFGGSGSAQVANPALPPAAPRRGG